MRAADPAAIRRAKARGQVADLVLKSELAALERLIPPEQREDFWRELIEVLKETHHER